MAVLNSHILHPFDGGTGEWRTAYAAVPEGFADWGEAIDALIAASPYTTDALTTAWVYVQLYSLLAEGKARVRSYQDADSAVTYFTPAHNDRLFYWQRQLSALRFGYADTVNVPVTVTI